MAFLSFITCRAQLTSNDINPLIGDTINIKLCCSNVSDPGMAGAGVVWDFSNADTMSSEIVTFMQPFPNVPGSNITAIQTLGNNNPNIFPVTTSYLIDTNKIDYLGYPNNVYTNPRKVLELPMDTSMNFTDHYSSSYPIGNNIFEKTGTTNVACDGFGTLITPEGTFLEVYRVREIREATDTCASLGNAICRNFDTYYWYEAGYHHPVLTFSISELILGNGQDTLFARSGNFISDINNLKVEALDVLNTSIYPNPANEKIQLKTAIQANSIEINSMTGKLIEHIQLKSRKETISIAFLEAGTYFLKVEYPNGRISNQRFIKQ
jgi:hypothetical protein